MRLFRRKPTAPAPPASPSPLAVLLAELERLSGEGNAAAEAWAWAIRNQRGAVDALLADVAVHVRQCSAWLTVNPLIKAVAQYERDVHGIDWSTSPPEMVRERMNVQDALDRRQAMLQRIAARQSARNNQRKEQELAALRATSGRKYR